MDFTKYRRLKKLVANSRDTEGYFHKIAASPFWYGVPLWSKQDYEWFYNKIKGGYNYATLFNPVKAA